MEIEEIMFEKFACNYVGYIPQTVSKSLFNESDLISIFRQLKRIPPKISAFFDRSKISKVFKSDHAKKDLDNYYLILATDGTIFHIDY